MSKHTLGIITTEDRIDKRNTSSETEGPVKVRRHMVWELSRSWITADPGEIHSPIWCLLWGLNYHPAWSLLSTFPSSLYRNVTVKVYPWVSESGITHPMMLRIRYISECMASVVRIMSEYELFIFVRSRIYILWKTVCSNLDYTFDRHSTNIFIQKPRFT